MNEPEKENYTRQWTCSRLKDTGETWQLNAVINF